MKTILCPILRAAMAATWLALAAGCATDNEARPVASKNISSGLVVQKEAPAAKAPPKKSK